MTPAEATQQEMLYVETIKEKPKKIVLNRATKRQLAKDLRREHVRATMPDMANDLRAKRRAKRRIANATRNKNRRLSKS